jgi:hypothetical protein
VLGLLASAAGLALAVLTRAGHLQVHMLAALPAIFAVGAFAQAWALSREPRSVVLGPHGLRIDVGGEERWISWEQIAWCNVESSALGHHRRLVLFGDLGERLAAPGASLAGFDDLVAAVKARVEARGDGAASWVRLQHRRRQAVFIVSAGVGFLALGLLNAKMAFDDRSAERELARDGVRGMAAIVRRWVAPDGVTTRLEYRVTLPDGRSATRNAEVDPGVWSLLGNAESVEVVYVPRDPGNSRLAIGEVSRRDVLDRPEALLVLSALIVVMSISFVVAGILIGRGWDADWDQRTHKLTVRRPPRE